MSYAVLGLGAASSGAEFRGPTRGGACFYLKDGHSYYIGIYGDVGYKPELKGRLREVGFAQEGTEQETYRKGAELDYRWRVEGGRWVDQYPYKSVPTQSWHWHLYGSFANRSARGVAGVSVCIPAKFGKVQWIWDGTGGRFVSVTRH
jgi:hypothetical protein